MKINFGRFTVRVSQRRRFPFTGHQKKKKEKKIRTRKHVQTISHRRLTYQCNRTRTHAVHKRVIIFHRKFSFPRASFVVRRRGREKRYLLRFVFLHATTFDSFVATVIACFFRVSSSPIHARAGHSVANAANESENRTFIYFAAVFIFIISPPSTSFFSPGQ